MRSLRRFSFALAAALITLLVSCSNQPSSNPETVSAAATKPSAPKMPRPITAAKALEKMQGFAQKQWASDAMPVHIESEPNREANGQDGTATVWTAVFASMRRGQIRSFHWSGSLEPDAPVQGVSAAASELPLTPDLSGKMFPSFLLKADTDKAAAIAGEHGGATVLKKNPEQIVKYIVVVDPKLNAPVVYVVYGEDVKSNKGIGVINGVSGTFLRATKGT